jgi:hypothetical protein
MEARWVGLGRNWGGNGPTYIAPEERSGVEIGVESCVQAQCSRTSNGGSALVGC